MMRCATYGACMRCTRCSISRSCIRGHPRGCTRTAEPCPYSCEKAVASERDGESGPSSDACVQLQVES
ncbi:hypothetical protein B0H17DRAFT_1051545, partial [Mycena rosella]